MPKKTMKRKPFDPYDTTNLGRQVKTVVVAVLACSVMLASYTVVVAVVSSIEPDLSAMLLDVLVITGGTPDSSTSVELFMPSRRSLCSLPNLPHGVTGHSFSGSLVCGGREGPTTCQRWNGLGWTLEEPLLQARQHHSAWRSKAGVLLLGGSGGQENTSELVSWDGQRSLQKWNLNYESHSACIIDDEESFVLVGGWQGEGKDHRRVTRYQFGGFEMDLPSLNMARYNSGCAFYIANNRKNYLVTGGGGLGQTTDSTEILYSGRDVWKVIETAALPAPLVGLRGATIYNTVYMTGGEDDNKERNNWILEFNPESETWLTMGRMRDVRSFHAVTIVKFRQYAGNCTLTVF